MQLKGTGIQARDLGKITYFHLFIEVQVEVECLEFHNFCCEEKCRKCLKNFHFKGLSIFF